MEWIKGNIPKKDGLYWVTVKVGEKLSAILLNYDSVDKCWHLTDRSYGKFHKDDIIAYMQVKIPSVYNPNNIGIKGYYYIKTINERGEISYWAKQITPINWSKVGYSTIEKAAEAAKRQRRLNRQEYPNEKRNYYVVDWDSQVVKVVAEDIVETYDL